MTSLVQTHRWHVPGGVTAKRAGIYLLHGTGEHAGRYAALAEHLAAQGYEVGAHDHPGHGLSKGKRGVIDPPGALITQAAIQIQSFASEIGSAPFLFGHSLGGVAAAELVLQHALPVAGLMLSAPAFVPRISSVNRFQLLALSHIAPTFTRQVPYDAAILTSDPEQQQIANTDELMHGEKSASLIGWLVDSGSRSLQLADQLAVKTLLLIAGADVVVDSAASRGFADCAPDHLVTMHDYPDYLHELLNEPAEKRERVIRDIDRWLEQVTSAQS